MRVQRQAVIVVHGIGEQVPMETLRGMVHGDGSSADPKRAGIVLTKARVFSEASPAPATCRDRIYSARWAHDTDALTDGARTKRSAADSITIGQLSKSDVTTDFFEYYWAPRFRDTTFGDVISWAVALIRRPRSTYSSARITAPSSVLRLVPLVITIVAIAIAAAGRFDLLSSRLAGVLSVIALLAAVLSGTNLGLLTTFRALVSAMLAALLCGVLLLDSSRVAAAVAFAGSGVFTLVLAGAGRYAARTVGDAARYLSHAANSVEESDLIQTGLLALLEQLHDLTDSDGTPRYERIVVVGHSLGAVIAYDAVTLLWQRRHAHIKLPSANSTSSAGMAARLTEETGRAIDSGSGREPPIEPTNSKSATAAYRRAQDQLSAALRNASPNPARTAFLTDITSPTAPTARWIITDLVTLGSPLTYADAFLAVDADRLRERFEERSLHRCPPTTQRSIGAKEHPYRSAPPARGGTPFTFLHQGAAFAAVKWTNRYFLHDLVGGPVAPHFGYGIDDAALPGTKKWMGWMLLANPHSSYWRFGKRATNNDGTSECRTLLHDTIYRPPVYVMTTPRLVDDQMLARLVDLLDPPVEERSDIEVQVRLQVGTRTGQRRPAYLPISNAPLPAAARDKAIEALLGESTELVFGDDPLGELKPDVPRSPRSRS